MDGIEKWMDEWMDGLMELKMDEWMEIKNGWMDGIEKWMDGWWMDGLIDGIEK